MPKFVSLFSLTSDTLARLIEHPEDRRGPVGRAAEAAGGGWRRTTGCSASTTAWRSSRCPNSAAQAAFVLAVTSSGVFRHVETHELIEADDLVAILQKAQTLRPSYRPPGQPSG